MLLLPVLPTADRMSDAQMSRPPACPRVEMAARLPAALQPFLTWLTARPAPGEAARPRSARSYVAGALAWTLGGCALTVLPFVAGLGALATALLVALGLLATSCGLGIFQVVIFHHCSHGTVFATRETNRRVGRMVSAFLLFKRFDDYQHEHMLHHSSKKLLTDEDEFADFVLDLCRLEAGMSKAALWRRVILNSVSPAFHVRFLKRRIEVALFSGDRSHDWMGRAFWAGLIGAALLTGTFWLFALAWILPVAILLQVATIYRILVEHRFPEPVWLANRDKAFMCHASIGVFPGRRPPELRADTLPGLAAWGLWWADMLTAQLFARLFVLVGDAPCHDFHHRRPATRKWTSYIHAREADLEAGSPGFPHEYLESWGLLNAVDASLASLAATTPEALGRAVPENPAPR